MARIWDNLAQSREGSHGTELGSSAYRHRGNACPPSVRLLGQFPAGPPGAMTSGFGIPSIILISCQTHSVQFIAMFRNRKVFYFAAAAVQTTPAPGGGGGGGCV